MPKNLFPEPEDTARRQQDLLSAVNTSLPPEAAEQILEALQSKIGKTLACEVCGRIDWQLEQKLFVPWPIDFGASSDKLRLPLNFSVDPMVKLRCKDCGNIKFFDYSVLGLPDLASLLGSVGGSDG